MVPLAGWLFGPHIWYNGRHVGAATDMSLEPKDTCDDKNGFGNTSVPLGV